MATTLEVIQDARALQTAGIPKDYGFSYSTQNQGTLRILDRIIKEMTDPDYREIMERRGYSLPYLQKVRTQIETSLTAIEKSAAKAEKTPRQPSVPTVQPEPVSFDMSPNPQSDYDRLRRTITSMEQEIDQIDDQVKHKKLGPMEAAERLTGLRGEIQGAVEQIRENISYDPDGYGKRFKDIGGFRASIRAGEAMPSGNKLLTQADQLIGKIEANIRGYHIEEGFKFLKQ